MIWRAFGILVALIGVSIALSVQFGAEVVVALGLLLAKLKLVLGKLGTVSWGTVGSWLKAQGGNFARIEVAKRWVTQSLLPLLVGAGLRRRIGRAVARVSARIRRQAAWLRAQFAALPLLLRVLIVLIGIAGTVVLGLASFGLWIIVFTLQVPIWIASALGALLAMLWKTLQKTLFRTLMFFQLDTLWGVLRRRLPTAYLARKRRFEFRVARAVVRRRRMTVRELQSARSSLALRLALLRQYVVTPKPAGPTRAERRGPQDD